MGNGMTHNIRWSQDTTEITVKVRVDTDGWWMPDFEDEGGLGDETNRWVPHLLTLHYEWHDLVPRRWQLTMVEIWTTRFGWDAQKFRQDFEAGLLDEPERAGQREANVREMSLLPDGRDYLPFWMTEVLNRIRLPKRGPFRLVEEELMSVDGD